MVVCGTLGFLIERFAYRPLRNRPKITALITAIGVSMLLEFGGQSRHVFGATPQAFPQLVPGIEKTPDPGREVLLARFELQSQYCGVFENFSQFVGNAEGDLLTVIHTPGLEWLILVNRRPLSPFLKLDHIVNTWGLGGFPVAIRLDENAMVEFVVRNVNLAADSQIQKVGGRITGRYWYNPAYGDANSRNGQFR